MEQPCLVAQSSQGCGWKSVASLESLSENKQNVKFELVSVKLLFTTV